MSIDLGKKSGAISLSKGDRVTIDDTGAITATVSFSKSTDYDVYAIVLLKDGSEKVVSTFGSEAQRTPTPQVLGVRHLGDVQRGGASALNTETLTITLSAEIDQVAVVVYSAQSNGAGSFRRYKATCAVDNGAGTVVTIPADQASDEDTVYTCVPAIIRNTPDGAVIERVEMYSAPTSEIRPSFVSAPKRSGLFSRSKNVPDAGVLRMDTGSKNLYK